MRPATANLLKLLVGIVALSAVFLAFGLGDLLVVIAALLLMVMLHELGHFATAKWTGMQVTEFFVGFGPRLWSVQRGETEYGVKAIPAGGYCRITGMTMLEEVEPELEQRSYRSKSYPRRLLVASAGSAMHFVMAFAIAVVALSWIGVPSEHIVEVNATTTFDGGVAPARAAGIAVGDRVLAINGRTLERPSQLTNAVHASAGKPVVLRVERDGKVRVVTVTPRDGRQLHVDGKAVAASSGPAVGYIGIGVGEGTEQVGLLSAIGRSGHVVASTTVAAGKGLVDLFSPAGIQRYAGQVADPGAHTNQGRPESIVGAVRTATQATHAGGLAVAEVLISLNIFIGLFNLMPMLPLDGGHIAIATYERVRSRRGRPAYHADVAKLMPVVWVFLTVLGLLLFSSLYLDLTHPVANPWR